MKAYWINRLGVYGDFLIEQAFEHSDKNLVKYPHYDTLLGQSFTENTIIVLDITQEKEISFISNYLSQITVQNHFSFVEKFLGFRFESDSYYKSQTEFSKKVLYIFKKLWLELRLNPSKLVNVLENPFATFTISDFSTISKETYPKSYALLGCDDYCLFIYTLFEELTGVKDYGLLILDRFDNNDDVLLNSLSKEEQNEVERLTFDGIVYQPKQGVLMLQ